MSALAFELHSALRQVNLIPFDFGQIFKVKKGNTVTWDPNNSKGSKDEGWTFGGAGTYFITIIKKNKSTNFTITINAEEDTTPPVITITGDNPKYIELGSTYTDGGATADGGETVTTSGTVDTYVLGTYTITYSATDTNGNTGTASRTVNVVSTTSPVTGNINNFTAYQNEVGYYSINPTEQITSNLYQSGLHSDLCSGMTKGEVFANIKNLFQFIFVTNPSTLSNKKTLKILKKIVSDMFLTVLLYDKPDLNSFTEFVSSGKKFKKMSKTVVSQLLELELGDLHSSFDKRTKRLMLSSYMSAYRTYSESDKTLSSKKLSIGEVLILDSVQLVENKENFQRMSLMTDEQIEKCKIENIPDNGIMTITTPMVVGSGDHMYCNQNYSVESDIEINFNLSLEGGSNCSVTITQAINETIVYVSATLEGIVYLAHGDDYITLAVSNLCTIFVDLGSFHIDTGEGAPESDICFIGDSMVHTDQGIFKIQEILPNIHTINNEKIIAVTRTTHKEDYLVKINKDAISLDVPNKETIMTGKHTILYENKLIPAINFPNKEIIPYMAGEILFNILKEKHGTMIVNNLIVETLNPDSDIGKLYTILHNVNCSHIERIEIFQKINKLIHF